MFGAFGKMLSGVFGSQEAKPPGLMERVSEGAKDALAGIPSAVVGSSITSKLQGKGQHRFMNAAYPGTSPHERLAGTASSVVGQSSGVSDAIKIARLQARNQKSVAKMQTDATKYAADRTSEAARGELPSKIEWNKSNAAFNAAQAQLTRAGLPITEERANFAREFAESGLRAEQTRNVFTTLATLDAQKKLDLDGVRRLLMKFPNASINNALDFYRATLEIRDDLDSILRMSREKEAKARRPAPAQRD